MAILRGGRRIGNFDIRLGLPRDRSLVDIAKDPRLQRKPGGSGTINRFISQINQGEGFSRTNRFIVRINPPAREFIDEFDMTPGNNDLESLTMIENIDMMCNSVVLPSRDINTANHLMYGPSREMPFAYAYSKSVEINVWADKFFRQRMFFENWQKKIMNIKTHHMNYYDNYIGSMDIFQLGQFDIEQENKSYQVDNASVTYAVRLHEVYLKQLVLLTIIQVQKMK